MAAIERTMTGMANAKPPGSTPARNTPTPIARTRPPCNVAKASGIMSAEMTIVDIDGAEQLLERALPLLAPDESPTPKRQSSWFQVASARTDRYSCWTWESR
jgi:hypothetical protein